MLIRPGAPSSSPTELYPFSSIKTLRYPMKSSVTRMSFPWKIKTSIFRNSPCACGCSLLKHVHSGGVLTPYGSGAFCVLQGFKACWRCRKHFPVLSLKTGKELTIRKLLQSYRFTAPGCYSEIFPHKKLFCCYIVGRQDPLCHLMLHSFQHLAFRQRL